MTGRPDTQPAASGKGVVCLETKNGHFEPLRRPPLRPGEYGERRTGSPMKGVAGRENV